MAIEVALVGEADGERDVGERELRVAEHLLDALEAAAQQIPVRWRSNRLLERAREMVWGKTGHRRQGIQADLFADVRLDEFANAIFQRWRKAPSVEVWRLRHRHEPEHAQPGL